jgi:hypothetical protein
MAVAHLRIAMLAFLLYVSAQSALAQDVDWKYYGGAPIDGMSYCFYDANTVRHTLSQQWTLRSAAKCRRSQ